MIAGEGTLRNELRSELSGRLRRSPLDFIREMDPAGDCSLWLDELTRPIAPEYDLTFAAELDEVGPTAVFAEVLPWDTDFFGFKVARLNAMIPLSAPTYQVIPDMGIAVDKLIGLCKNRGVQYLFAPVDARDVAVARALTRRGFEIIESRLYGHRELIDFDPIDRYDVRLAMENDVEALSDVAESVVNPYDRFHADPVMAGEPANRIMREWVRASICDGFADGTMVPNVANPGAFLTIKDHQARWERWGKAIGQAPFGAVHQSFRGWYIKLISEICIYLREDGAEHFYMVSQATNNAVVRCWEKLGLRYGKNELIFRKVPGATSPMETQSSRSTTLGR